VVFAASKIFWFIAAPGNLLLILLLVGVARLLLTRGRRGTGLVSFVALALLAIAALPLGSWLGLPLENRFPALLAPPAHVDGIVLLGGAVNQRISKERGRPAIGGAGDRITATAALARLHPEARVLFTGGDASLIPTGGSEAEPTRELLVSLGVAPERILIEDKSRNTWENATLSYAVAQPKPGETWVLVTSAAHMPRAVGCFRRAGWTIVPYPVDYHSSPAPQGSFRFDLAAGLSQFSLNMQEWVGLVAYYLLGRTDALLPLP
jgi:uncharacterized SAM-binding protein YcdF (DUF218 family)